MKPWKTVARVLAFLALPALACPLKAADSVKITYAFLQRPTEIPGGRVLAPGDYAFKMLDESGPSKVVQILLALPAGTVGTPSNYNANKAMPLVATVVAVPDYKSRPGRGVVTFWQIPGGERAVLKTLSFPLDAQSLVFVYQRARAAELAKAANQPVPSTVSELNEDVNALKGIAAKATRADGGDVEVAQVFGKQGDRPPAEEDLSPGVHFPPGCNYEAGEVSCKYRPGETRN
jgi:hypothetical protein